VHSGITSLPTSLVTPKWLLALVRAHWGIKNGLRYRQDRTLDEDRSQLRMGHAPHLLALFNTTVIGLQLCRGEGNLLRAQRRFDSQFDTSLAVLAACKHFATARQAKRELFLLHRKDACPSLQARC